MPWARGAEAVPPSELYMGGDNTAEGIWGRQAGVALRRRKGDVVSYAENNAKGGVRMMGRQNPIKRTDVTTLLLLLLLCYSRVPLHRPRTFILYRLYHQLKT